MRRVGWCLALGVLCVGLLPAPAAGAPAKGAPLETLLPAETLINVSWTGLRKHQAEYRKTAVYKLIKHPDVDAFFCKLFNSLGKGIVHTPGSKRPKQRAQLKVMFKLSRVALHGEVCLAVMAASVKGGQAAILVRPSADETEPCDKLLDELVKGIARPAPAAEGEQPDPNKFVIGPNTPLQRAKIGEVRVLAIGAGALGRIEAVVGGEAVSLMKDAGYSRVYRKTGGTKSIALIYLGTQQILTKLKPQLPPPAVTVMDDLGLMGVKAVAWSVGFEDKGMTTYIYLDVPAPRKGLFKMADVKPVTLADFRVVPSDAHFVAGGRFKARQFYDMLVSLAKKVIPAPPADAGADGKPVPHPVDAGIQSIEKKLEFKIGQDLLDSLGDMVILYSSRSDGMFITGLTLAVPIKDVDTFKKCGRQLMAMMADGIKKSGVVFDRVKVEPTQYFMRVLRIPGNCPFTPTVAVSDEYLLVSLYPQGVKSALRRAGKLPAQWTPPAGFAESRRHLPAELKSMRYVDPEGALRVITAALPVIGSFLWDDLKKSGVDFDVALIPPIGEITEGLFPNVSGGYVDDEGITMKTYASVTIPVPGGVLSAGALMGGVGAAIVGAQTKAKHARAQAMVQQAVTALEMYRNDVGSYPTTAQGLKALVTQPKGAANWSGPYVSGGIARLRDPWGQMLRYTSPGRRNKEFDLWSTGPDGKDGTGDEVGNWAPGAGRMPKGTKAKSM